MAGSMGLSYGLAGALICELVEAGLLRIEGKDLVAPPAGSARDEILDEVLGIIHPPSGRAISSIGSGRSAGREASTRRVLDRLVERRILQKEDHRLLLVFPTKRYPQTDPMPEYGIREGSAKPSAA